MERVEAALLKFHDRLRKTSPILEAFERQFPELTRIEDRRPASARPMLARRATRAAQQENQMRVEPPSLYRGSIKHKARPATGAKGTLCPEWTHATSTSGLGIDMSRHRWESTIAHRLFSEAEPVGDERRRYATDRGIAFEAKPTADGTWHGFPVPWEAVPAELRRKWMMAGRVTRTQIRRAFSIQPGDIGWALDMDSE